MGLGPRIHIPVSQQLVMTQQLQQAIKLLPLSNLENNPGMPKELGKNPLLKPLRGRDRPPGKQSSARNPNWGKGAESTGPKN